MISDLPINRRILALAGLSALIAPPAIARALQKIGTVTELAGQAFADLDAAARLLSVAATVHLEETIRTVEASRLKMQLSGDTRLSLGQNVRVRIDRYLASSGGDIHLESGAMLFDKASRIAKGGVRVHSPFGLIAVRGTTFFAGPSNAPFAVFVEKGEVEVRGGGRSVRLKAGDGTDFAAIGAPPSPPKQWGAARVQAALASVS